MAKKIKGMSPFSDARCQAEDDLRTLQRACEIRKDPKRLKAAQELAKEKLEELAKVSAQEPMKY